MRASFHAASRTGVSASMPAPVTLTLWSPKSKPKLKSARRGGGPSKARAHPGSDPRPLFARNQRKLNRKSPGVGGTQKSATSSLHGPAWVSRADFFSAAKDFERSKEVKESEKISCFNATRAALGLIRPFISWTRGEVKSLSGSKPGPVGKAHALRRRFAKSFFRGATAESVAKFRVGG